MSDQNPIGVTLKEHLEALLTEQNKALELAREVYQDRLDVLNHFKEQQLEDRALYLRSDTYEVYHRAIEHRVDALERRLGRVDVSISRIVGIGIGAVFAAGLIGGIIGHLLK